MHSRAFFLLSLVTLFALTQCQETLSKDHILKRVRPEGDDESKMPRNQQKWGRLGGGERKQQMDEMFEWWCNEEAESVACLKYQMHKVARPLGKDDGPPNMEEVCNFVPLKQTRSCSVTITNK